MEFFSSGSYFCALVTSVQRISRFVTYLALFVVVNRDLSLDTVSDWREIFHIPLVRRSIADAGEKAMIRFHFEVLIIWLGLI